MKRLRQRRRTTVPDIPTSSMADIAFLLIIFFMLTAVFTSRQGLRFGYPEETNEAVEPQEAIHIRIEGEGIYSVDRQAMDLGEMGGYIKNKMNSNPKKPVIIQTLPDAPYAAMIDVFDLLRQLEVQQISIPTKSDREIWKQFGIFE